MTKPTRQNNCGCCAGISQATPVRLHNLPSQNTLAYRIGTHSTFKQSMLAALSNAQRPALLPLGTRDDDDFTLACLDGVATMLDVLTFYQERYANEHFLTTSTERRSVLEMAQLIGYELSPGVASATHLAFTLQETPGIPTNSADPIIIPARTRVQSVPGQNEEPQVFETIEDIEARSHWNAVAVQTTLPYVPDRGDLDIYIDGLNNNVEAGDAILIVGQDRMDKDKGDSGSERWDVRVIKQVEKDNAHLRTRLIWRDPLGHVSPTIQPSGTDVKLFVFRRRASLFGHNAPDPRLMSEKDNSLSSLLEDEGVNLWWNNFTIQNNQIDLASPEDNVVAGSWIALVSNEDDMGSADLPGYVELYRAEKVSSMSRTDYGMSSKITRIEIDTTESISHFALQETLALVASEELPIHRRPLRYPVFNDTLHLHTHIDGLVPNQYLSISGQRQRLKVAPGITGLSLQREDGSNPLNESDSVQLVGIPEKLSRGGTLTKLTPEAFGTLINGKDSAARLQLRVIDRDGSSGTVISRASDWLWDNDLWDNENDPRVAEIAQIGSSDNDIQNDRDRTTLTLNAALNNIYRRDSVQINFNVAPANHGETVVEILGNGDARKTDQQFILKQAPLTHVSADTPSGSAASLEVRVNELRWDETASLYQANHDARVYRIQNRDNGSTAILFGDGVEGGRLPTGQTNVRAIYRKYIGADANLNKDKLTTLLQKPLGVTEVTNPEPATGGANPEVIDDAKQNAPLTVLTLDRAVSVTDYQNFARAFSGVAKAHALWIHSGPSKGIFITLAGINGAHIPDTSSTYINLMNALRRYGDPMLPLRLMNYSSASFALGMAVKVNDDAVRDTVLEALESALRAYFSFANRDFGQHVSQDEILAVAHSVQHIEAVRITRFYQQKPGAVESVSSIIASHLPVASLTIAPEPAQLLTLSDEPLEMESFS